MTVDTVAAALIAIIFRLGLPETIPGPAWLTRAASYLPLGAYAVLYRPAPVWTVAAIGFGWLMIDVLDVRGVRVAIVNVIVSTAGIYLLASHVGWRLAPQVTRALYALAPAAGPVPTLAILGGAILVAQPANRIVRDILAATGVSPGEGGNARVGFIPVPGGDDSEHELRVGRMVGVLERLVILALLLRGDSSLAVGLVLTAKSVARFDELRNRPRAEYYIVGTLASILVALLVAQVLAVVVHQP